MDVSIKLARDFNTILTAHLATLFLLSIFTTYLWSKAKKTPLLYSYLTVIGMIALWMIAKILKTLSPNIEMRWFFILVQYFAIDCLGIGLIVFSLIYKTNEVPKLKFVLLISILPMISFLAILTNPWHMQFYSYFDIYKDRFGLLFYLGQSIHYVYLIIGIVILTKGFTKQPVFRGREGTGILFGAFVMLPLIANFYYILFKMDFFEWIFPFPVFDFSPIAASISLMLFIIPALKFRFFDLFPFSIRKLYDIVPVGIAYLDENLNVYSENLRFKELLNDANITSNYIESIELCQMFDQNTKDDLINFLNLESQLILELHTKFNHYYKLVKRTLEHKHLLIFVYDMTMAKSNLNKIIVQNEALINANYELDKMTKNTNELNLARSKAKIAQNVHDILGHCLTVVISAGELALLSNKEEAKKKALQMEELLTSSLNDLRNTFSDESFKVKQTSLLKALNHLKNDSLQLEINVNGEAYELSSDLTESIYRVCQEAITNAIKHGHAKIIYFVFKYNNDGVEFYAIDNGFGCKEINLGYGLSGIEKRVVACGGNVTFSSDGESGFTIYSRLPRSY